MVRDPEPDLEEAGISEDMINLCLSSVDTTNEAEAFEQCKAALMKYAGSSVHSAAKEVNYAGSRGGNFRGRNRGGGRGSYGGGQRSEWRNERQGNSDGRTDRRNVDSSGRPINPTDKMTGQTIQCHGCQEYSTYGEGLSL